MRQTDYQLEVAIPMTPRRKKRRKANLSFTSMHAIGYVDRSLVCVHTCFICDVQRGGWECTSAAAFIMPDGLCRDSFENDISYSKFHRVSPLAALSPLRSEKGDCGLWKNVVVKNAAEGEMILLHITCSGHPVHRRLHV